jgi:SAM-dependent methyltransferase
MDYRKRIYEHYASCFQDAGAHFDTAAAERWGRAYDSYLRGWLPPPGTAILDLACGGGNLLYFFKSRGHRRLAGVDISPEQIALARQVVPEVEEGNLFVYLETSPADFDLITALDIIEHLHKDEVLRFLDGCYAALRPGGRLILQMPNADTPWGTHLRYGDFTHETCFQPNSISRLLRMCGFSQIETREQGPLPWGYSLKSSLRWLVWQGIRLGLKVYNLAETGDSGSGVFTRVFLASGVKS